MDKFNVLIKFLKRTDEKCIRFKNSFSFLILLTIGAVMLFLSWQKWPDILVDFGKELYVPWQINNGKVLYRDIAWFHGPLSFYLNAFLFKIFGTHLMTLAIFNIILIFILTILIYRIFLFTTDWLTATSASAAFLGIFAFSQYVRIGNYNFVCPYSYNLTHGIFLTFLMIYFYLIYLTARQKRMLLVMGVLLGLIFLSKVEVFLASAIAIFTGIGLIIFIDRLNLSKVLRMLGCFFLGFFIPILFFVIYFSYYMSLNKAVISILFPYTVIFTSKVSSDIFFRTIMGTDDVLRNSLKLASQGAGYLAMFIDFALIGYSIRRISRHNFLIWGTVIILSLLLFLKLCLMGISSALADTFRPLPVIILVFGGFLLISLLRSRNNPKEANRLMALLVMTIFAFLLILKIILNVHLYHYGFALAMPATLLLVAVLMCYMPICLGGNLSGRILLVALSVILLGVFLIRYMSISKHIYSDKTFPLEFGLDTIYDFNSKIVARGVPIYRAVIEIEKIIKKNENFIVFPEGATLNYLTRRVNPTPYHNFMPTEMTCFGEKEILKSFIKSKADYIILIDNVFSEYQYSPLSENQYSIFNWITKNYKPIVKIGNMPFSGKGFGILICKRSMYPS